MLTGLFQIAKNTFRENLREPIYLLVLLTALVLIGILPAFTLFVFREQVKLVVDSAMAAMLSFGWIVAVLSASHAITEEIETGTAILLLAKPINRVTFIVGKILGILLGLGVFSLLTGTATLIAVRVAKDQFYFDQKAFTLYFVALGVSLGIGGLTNYLKRSSFAMASILSMVVLLPLAGVVIRFLPVDGKAIPYSWSILPALILIAYAVWMMGTLATALSTRLALIPNLLICSVVFLVGLVSDFLLGTAAEHNIFAAAAYALIPNWQLFWMADALAADRSIPLSYVMWGGVYLLLFTGVLTVLAAWMFRHREVGRQAV